jgi:hypothetical protein
LRNAGSAAVMMLIKSAIRVSVFELASDFDIRILDFLPSRSLPVAA